MHGESFAQPAATGASALEGERQLSHSSHHPASQGAREGASPGSRPQTRVGGLVGDFERALGLPATSSAGGERGGSPGQGSAAGPATCCETLAMFFGSIFPQIWISTMVILPVKTNTSKRDKKQAEVPNFGSNNIGPSLPKSRRFACDFNHSWQGGASPILTQNGSKKHTQCFTTPRLLKVT